jgi:hypothetical protein
LNNVARDDLSDDASALVRDEYVSIVVAIAAGDSGALAELYDATVNKVHALVRSIIRNVADAEEVTCDVWASNSVFSRLAVGAISWADACGCIQNAHSGFDERLPPPTKSPTNTLIN